MIPVVVRACDWRNSLFEKLQALPTNAKPITSWPNLDEALYDVTQGIKLAIEADAHGELSRRDRRDNS